MRLNRLFDPMLPRAVAAALLLLFAGVCLGADSGVKLWEEDIVLPTYLAGDPEPNPMFYFGRASQGAEGRVYPYPLYDTLTNKKVDKSYRIVYLENEFVRIGVIPEIGGRLFEGYDKTNKYHFFYRQHVIKPALIGLIGAWVSGGVEWNVPHHHRASTFLPVQYRLEEHPDGSKTLWTGELEVRHRMRWAIGYTLRPGSSLLEVSLRVLNRTPVVNTMLCWANVAVHVNEDYQVIFPPSTQFGTHHSKREMIRWPIADSRYGNGDFTKGVDVSWFKNHISSNSIFAWNYEDDFLAGYDHGREAGLMAVADHHIVPGKKLWTWGNGARGRMWDHILTDEDGPYIELMVGAYSDNQPDYSWLQPYEAKSFQMHWYPIRDIGGAKNANLDATVNLDVEDGKAKVGFYTTKPHSSATVTLTAGDRVLLEETISIGPAKAYSKEVPVPSGVDEHDLRASISAGDRELVSYSPIRLEKKPMPETVKAPLPPKEIETTEELYLTGLRIEQFHNPALDAEPYWEEALRRDPGDTRVNTAMGVKCLKRGRFAEAEQYFRKALERLTAKYTSPKDGEATYYLGVALAAQGRHKEAFDAFYKSTWSSAWRDPGYFSLAELACRTGEFDRALDFVTRSLQANALNIRALNLKAAILRHSGESAEARETLASAHDLIDPLDVRMLAEEWLLSDSAAGKKRLRDELTAFPAAGLETASEYMNAGLWEDGVAVLGQMIEAAPDKAKISPLVYYYLAYFAEELGRASDADKYYTLAAKMPPDYVFPFQHENIEVLRRAMKANPRDARAPYYLGNLLYDWQPEEAIRMWEQSAALDPSFPIVHRNLGVAYSHQQEGDSIEKAIASLEKAVAAEEKHAIHFFELDQLYKAAGADPERRLSLMEQNHSTVTKRDDALARQIELKVVMGKYDDALELLTGRSFNVWEGGSLNVVDQWTDAHLLRGQRHFKAERYEEALAEYEAALKIPANLPTERLASGGRVAEAAYLKGQAYAAQGDKQKAQEAWRESAEAELPRSRRRSGILSGTHVQQYYQALSRRELGEEGRAKEIFKQLVKAGTEALNQTSSEIDFFAKFGEQQSQRAALAMAHYVAGLGHLGLGEESKAKRAMKEALKASPDHLGARIESAALD